MSEQSEKKLAHRRLQLLEFAETLGNVTEACRKMGISRSQFYAYKKRYQEQGLEGLKDLPPIHKTHPQTTAPAVVAQIVEWAYKQTTWGCEKISIKLKQGGTRLSAVTVQDILHKHELGSRQQRLFAAEKRHLAGELELDEPVVAALERHNPCYRERHIESSRPGELLSVDTSRIGQLDGTRITLHAAVDTYGSYGFGLLHSSKQPEASALLLHMSGTVI